MRAQIVLRNMGPKNQSECESECGGRKNLLLVMPENSTEENLSGISSCGKRIEIKLQIRSEGDIPSVNSTFENYR